MAGVIKEWKCAAHGPFEGSHPICPHYGCRSEQVEREFRTPVGIGTGVVGRTERDLRRTADMMGIRNFRSSYREGDVSYAGRAAESDAPLGTEVLWGDDKIARVMGKQRQQMVAEAAAPLSLASKGEKDPYLRVNNGMRSTANTTPLFSRPLPPAEVRRDPDSGSRLVQVQP